MIAAATTGLGVASAVMQAKEENAQKAAAQASAREMAVLQRGQLYQSAAVEKRKSVTQFQQVMGRIRTAAAAGGMASSSGSIKSMEQQAAFDTASNIAVLENNLAAQSNAVESGYAADFNQLSTRQSPILAGITGGLQGLGTGLSLINSYKTATAE